MKGERKSEYRRERKIGRERNIKKLKGREEEGKKRRRKEYVEGIKR
jgi:hypothetical protein